MRKRRMGVDLDESQVSELSLGDEVRIITVGKVTELRSKEEYELSCCSDDGSEKEVWPPRMEVEVESTSVEKAKNEFEALAEDD